MSRYAIKSLGLASFIGIAALQAHAADIQKLDNGIAVSSLSGSTGSEQFFMLDVPEGAQNIRFTISGGNGDADLYVKAGEKPTTSNYDCRPYLVGNNESCNAFTEANLPYYLMLRAYQEYSGVTLTASYSTGGDAGDNGGGDDNGSDSGNDGGTANGCTLTATQQALLDAHNEARAVSRSCGGTNYPAAPALSWNCQLATAATKHSQDMASNNFMSHTGSNGSQPGDRISAEGYQYSTWAENVAAGYTTIDQVMNGWLQSSGHCSNIMSTSVTEMGADLVTNSSSDYTYYWTGVFGRPQ